MKIRQYLRSSLLIAMVSFAGISQAAIIDVIKIGTWTGTGAGNPTGVDGPGMATGQKYVIKISYDDTSTVETRDVLTESFGDSLQDMSVIELTGTGGDGDDNTLDIFVPMEGLDSGTPFIYTQDESNHYSYGPNAAIPTLNFADGSDVSDKANIIGVEFEGDFVAGANNNVIELYNTAADEFSSINQVGQVNNLVEDIAVREVNGLTDAVDVTVGDGTVTYDAATLVKTTTLAVQSNDLGAGRSDGETFLDADWTEGGGALTGNLEADGANIEVGIANSGLTNSGSSTTWGLTLTEQMTGLSDTAQVLVNYTNAVPTSSLSATANADGYDFAYSASDADIAVNALIAGFEMLSYEVFVNGVATALFNGLISTGALSLTELALFNEFGNGLHTLEIIVTDLAADSLSKSVDFLVDGLVSPIPVPPAFALMATALAFLGFTGFRRRS